MTRKTKKPAAHDPAQTATAPDMISGEFDLIRAATREPGDPTEVGGADLEAEDPNTAPQPVDFQEDAPRVAEEETAPVLRRSVIAPERKKAYVDGNCGDEVAAMLKGKTLDELKVMATEWDIAWAWDHLNPGMQRMNFGNKLRTAVKKRAAEAAHAAELAAKMEAEGQPEIAAALVA
jgi:hypothetical protein